MLSYFVSLDMVVGAYYIYGTNQMLFYQMSIRSGQQAFKRKTIASLKTSMVSE